jgi:hypothetical protein
MASYIVDLLTTDSDILAMPTRLITTLGRNVSVDTIISLAIRMVLVGALVAAVRKIAIVSATYLNRSEYDRRSS